jgi:hypothetical protein
MLVELSRPTALEELGLTAPTAAAPHRNASAFRIDHVAVPAFWNVTALDRVSAFIDGVAISDHDACVIEVD